MSTGRRISVRKIIQTLVTLIAVTGCAVAMMSADRQQRNRTIRDVRLKIESPGGVHFLNEDMVRNALFTTRHVDPKKLKVAGMDERTMEAILQSNPWVRDAQVYTDAERVMHISVVQRVPVVRLFEEDGNSYYLDAALKSMPLSGQYAHYTPVVTGVPHLRNDSTGDSIKGTILGLVRYLNRQPFWRAQISQISMRPDGGFELIPVLGRQHIIIGDTARIGEKLTNLFEFYRQIQNRIGWDKYTSIDLRYNGQVVAAPALKWKAPVDRAISNMNWLKAIMESAPAQASRPGGDASAIPDSSNAAPQPSAQRPAPVTSVVAPAARLPAAMPVKAPITRPAAVKPLQKAKLRPAVKGAILPKSPAPKALKVPLKVKKAPLKAEKKITASPAPKNTTRHEKNTKPHAATNR